MSVRRQRLQKKRNQKFSFWKRAAAMGMAVALALGVLKIPLKAEESSEEGTSADSSEMLYEVDWKTEGKGNLVLDQTCYPERARVSFTLEPAPGYVVDTVSCRKEIEGAEEEVLLIKEDQKEVYYFIMPGQSVKLSVLFGKEKERQTEAGEETTTEKDTGSVEETTAEKDTGSMEETTAEKNTGSVEEATTEDSKGQERSGDKEIDLNTMEESEQKMESGKGKALRAAKGDIGVKQILDYSLDASGTSYLGYKSPITGNKMRVSLHRTADNEVAYCLERTKASDKDDYNWGYEVISGKDTKYTDLQRNILLCGYPGNSTAALKKMYGISANGRTAEQATQLALWVGNYMIGEGVSLSSAWSSHSPYNMGEYEAVALSKAILSRADDMLRQNLSVKGELEGTEGDKVNYCFSLTTNGQYYPIKGTISNLPEGTEITSDKEIVCNTDGSFTMNLVKGTGKIHMSFPKYTKAANITLKADGTIPIPPSYGGILYYENSDSDYQSVVRVKEVTPFYSEKKAVIEWKPEPWAELHLKKTSEDDKVDGITFNLSGPNQYSKDFTTDAKGEIDFGELVPGIYVITEKTPQRYVTAKAQTIELKDGDDKTVTFHNVLRKMIITLEKKDSQGGIARGDGKLAGAEYTIYNHEGKAVDVLIIGADHKARSGQLPIDSYTIKETKAPEGYNLDPSVYRADGTTGDANLELTSYSFISSEKIIEGKIKIMKILENPDSQSDVMIPAKGIRFSYHLNSNPSYRMTFTLDENGMGESEWMPYGIYTLEEENVPKGWKAVLPKTVRIDKERETISYYLIDKLDHRECKIVKKDKETGRQIAFAGTRFQIRRKDTGEIVSQNILYPVKKKINEFTTNEEGILMLPEKLQAGDYLLYELEAPEGYVKEEKPVEFTVPSGDDSLVEVVMENQAQKAELTIEKTGPVFSGVEEKEEENYKLLIPVFEDKALEGVGYELTAMEDIMTLDGTCHMKKGDKFEAVTDQEGKAVFSELYPGLYELKEIKAPDGYIADGEPKEVKITYGDPLISLKQESLSFTNRCQVPKLKLTKQMEKNTYLEVTEPWKEVLFGLYAAKDLKGQGYGEEEEKVLIPKDTLMDLYDIGESGEGISRYKTVLLYGQYYMKEIKTHPSYVLDSYQYEFSFDFEKENPEEVREIEVAKDIIKNRPAEGNLEFTKQEISTGKVIPGCKVEIKNEEGKVIVQGTTNQKGEILFEKLPIGKYTYREYEAPEGYRLDEKEYPFEIREDGEIVKAVMENELIKIEEATTEPPKDEVPTTETPVTEVPTTKADREPSTSKEQNSPKEKKTSPVKTGDVFPLGLSVTLMTVSLGGIIGICIWKRKKSKKS